LVYLFTGIIVLLITIILLVRNPLTQTILARIATTYLSGKLNTEIKIEKLAITGFNSISLTNLLVKDLNNDTLAYAEHLSASYAGRFSNIDIKQLNSIDVKNADIRIKKFKGSNTTNLQFLLDFFSKSKKAQIPAEQSMVIEKQDVIIQLDEISITNSSFIFIDPNKEKIEVGVDFSNIAIQELNLNARDLLFEKDTFSIHVNQVSLYEKSGFNVDSLTCDFKLSPVLLEARNLLARTSLNKLDLDFSFNYESMHNFKDFIHKVKINTSIRPSIVNLTEVGYFAPVMFNMDNRLRISGKLQGTVSNFKARNLKVGIGKTTQFRGDIQMNGLPDITETFTHLTVTDFISTVEDAGSFRLPTDKIYIDLPEMLTKFGLVRIKGKFTGFYNDFVSYANFRTGIGEFDTDILLRVNRNNDIEYNGHLEANDFHAGRFFNIEKNLKQLDLTANISGSGIAFENMHIMMDGVIDSLEFFDNIYNEVKISGGIENKKFVGEMNVRDENIYLDFNGSLDYGQSVPAYNFTAIVRDAYLDRINLVDRHPSSRLSTTLNINFMGDNIDNTQGIIILDSTVYEENDKQYTMDDFTLSITRDLTTYAFIRLYSDILDATIEGQYTLRHLPASLKNLFNNYVDTLIVDSSYLNREFRNQDFIFSVNLKNTQPLSDLFIPELQIAEGTRFSGGYNAQIGNLFFDGSCPEIYYNGMVFNNWYSDFYIQNNSLQFITGAESVFYSDTLKSDSLFAHLKARNDTIIYQIKWKDFSEVPFSSANLSGNFILLGGNKYQFNFDQADIKFSDTLWKVNTANNLWIDSSMITFENMGVKSINQNINFHGVISPNPSDTLLLSFSNFDLSNFDLLLQTIDIDMDGLMNGHIKMIDYYHSPFYLSNLQVDDFYFNKEKLGEADIKTIWDSGQKAFDISGSIIYTGNIGKDTTLFVQGKYFPEKENDNFDIAIDLNKYKLATLEPFTKSFSSDLNGMASGAIYIKGSKNKPELRGEINLMRTAMLIDYMHVKYYFADKIKFGNNRIYFDNIVINDSLNNQAIASGSIYHDHLTDFSLDLNISTNQLATMNTMRSQNDIFYGRIIGSGDFRIHGPFQDLTMDISARSEKGTSIKIPVSYGTEVGSNDYIIFAGSEDENQDVKEDYHVDQEGITLNLNLDVTNDADIQMFMPYNMGNIRARGKGDLKMDINPAGNFNMEGEYVINRGSFFFTLGNIINRNFDISRGSRVSWTGDPYNAQISLKAIYKVKTTLGDYGPPEDSATRVPVDCIIHLSNNLLNPVISFSVEFPDLKDDIKQTIYSRLDTTDQAEMSRQMISLLVLNNFYQPSGYSGSVGFNTFDLVTNQLSNWLSQISNDFDIGVKYRPGDEISSQEVEVALSTQLFDERVLIDGNVGMQGNESTSQNTTNIVGEVTVEVKITQDGRFRAKAFNRSNNNYLYRNYAPYTQGVGVFYTQEFNKIGELFRGKKKKNADKKKENKKQPATNDDTVKK